MELHWDSLSMLAQQFRWALVASLLLGSLLPVMGTYIVCRRQALLGLTVPQLGALGLAVAFLLQVHYEAPMAGGVHGFSEPKQAWILTGALLATVLGSLMLLQMNRVAPTSGEGRLGVVYAGAAALTVVFIAANPFGEATLTYLLQGQVLTVLPTTVVLIAGGVIPLVLLTLLVQRRLVVVGADPDFGISLGMRVARWNTLLHVVLALVIAVGVFTVGPLFVFGFLVIPPMAARQVVHSGMLRFQALSAAVGAACALTGFFVSLLLDWPLGPTEVVACLAALGLAYIAGKFGGRRIKP